MFKRLIVFSLIPLIFPEITCASSDPWSVEDRSVHTVRFTSNIVDRVVSSEAHFAEVFMFYCVTSTAEASYFEPNSAMMLHVSPANIGTFENRFDTLIKKYYKLRAGNVIEYNLKFFPEEQKTTLKTIAALFESLSSKKGKERASNMCSILSNQILTKLIFAPVPIYSLSLKIGGKGLMMRTNSRFHHEHGIEINNIKDIVAW